jgi:ABC-type transport system involved in cytochrome bd biosynthesis fused ATPase/permease subunit
MQGRDGPSCVFLRQTSDMGGPKCPLISCNVGVSIGVVMQEGHFMSAHPVLLNAVLIIVMTFALDWRESRWTRRAARRQRSDLRPLRRSAPVLPRHDASHEPAVSARRRAS